MTITKLSPCASKMFIATVSGLFFSSDLPELLKITSRAAAEDALQFVTRLPSSVAATVKNPIESPQPELPKINFHI